MNLSTRCDLEQEKELGKFKQHLNTISPTMCSAKWLQSTLYLHTGNTHSCHHPKVHKISTNKLANNPNKLHNTDFKLFQRQLMLAGKAPKECDYCFQLEKQNSDLNSDRILKSANPLWGRPYLEEVLSSGNGTEINPRYLEIVFSNTCNFSCSYCTPDLSSTMWQEWERHGPYPLDLKYYPDLPELQSLGKTPLSEQNNPYLRAFWQWLPDLYKDLRVLRVSGGEPFLSKDFWHLLDFIEQNPHPNLKFIVNTNLSLPHKLNDFIARAHRLENEVEIVTSCEDIDLRAEYIRRGMKFSKFSELVETVLAETDLKLTMTMTVNALSLGGTKSFLNWIGSLRKKYNKHSEQACNRIPLSINRLSWPGHLSTQVLPKELKKKIQADIEKIDLSFLYYNERAQLEQLYQFLKIEYQDKELLKNFALFINEYDRRNGLCFSDTFPELTEFLMYCQAYCK